MKKQYFRIGLIFALTILVIFASALTIYTRYRIKDANKRFTDVMRNNRNGLVMDHAWDLMGSDQDGKIDHANRSYSRWDSYLRNAYDYEKNVDGRYSAVVDIGNNYQTIIETRDFLRVHIRYTGGDTQSRCILFDEPFPNDPESNWLTLPNISGSYCDNTYIFDGVLSWSEWENGEEKIYSINIGHPDSVNLSEAVPFEEAFGDYSQLDVELITFGPSSRRKLNETAKEKTEEYLDLYKNGNYENSEMITEEGLFTTYCGYMIESIDDEEYLTVYSFVFKPLKFVLQEYSGMYVILLIGFFLSEAVAIFTIRKLYKNAEAYEIRNRRFTRGIAHELKTPLAITKACVENWEYLEEDQKPEYSKKIISEVDHMTDLITRLLELSKLSSGNIELHKESVELMSLTKNVYGRMRDLARERKLDIEIKGEANVNEFPVYADLDMMNIVISNFISNAIKFSDSKVRINLGTSGKKVNFTISNDGTKIAKLDQKKVWDTFYKTDESRSDRMNSSGVGLSVVKNILDLHKAKYGCYSDDTETVFWFTMDLDKKQ